MRLETNLGDDILAGEILGFRCSEKYWAARATVPSFKLSAGGLLLNVTGRSVDKVGVLASPMPEAADDYDGFQRVLHEWEAHIRTALPSHTGEIYPGTFWRLLIADGQTRGNDSDHARQQLYESWDNLRAQDGRTPENPWEPIAEMSIVNSRTSEFVAMYKSVSPGRRLTITERGHLALVSSDAEVGGR